MKNFIMALLFVPLSVSAEIVNKTDVSCRSESGISLEIKFQAVEDYEFWIKVKNQQQIVLDLSTEIEIMDLISSKSGSEIVAFSDLGEYKQNTILRIAEIVRTDEPILWSAGIGEMFISTESFHFQGNLIIEGQDEVKLFCKQHFISINTNIKDAMP